MSKLLTNEQINNYEEDWQRRFYRPSGDGKHYIHCCEICSNSYGERIPGGHYICEWCKRKMKLEKEETIIKWGNRMKRTEEELKLPKKYHPAEPSKRERKKAWKKIIREDYRIELFNKNFPYK